MGDDFITGGEFGRFRADFTNWQVEIRRQMADGFAGTHERLDDINGRGRTNSEAIRVLETEVHSLTEHGCAQYEKHRETLETVVVPTLARVARPRVWDEWHPAAKVGASVGGFALLATLMELVARVLAHFGI